jgi:hypothetical protein
MHKFSDLKVLVEHHLNGHLEKLRVDYEDDITMRMEFAYLDDDEFHLYYDICVHTERETIDFLEHYCNFGRDFINLSPFQVFEEAVRHYLFDKK